MSSIWDYVNAINHNKKDLLRNTENDDLASKSYNGFMINRSLSYFIDTILYANEINKYPQLDNLLQNDYLLNSIRAKKRFSKWSKREMDSDLEAVKVYFGFNNRKAETALSILTREQLDEIHKVLDKGGQ